MRLDSTRLKLNYYLSRSSLTCCALTLCDCIQKICMEVGLLLVSECSGRQSDLPWQFHFAGILQLDVVADYVYKKQRT